ncbi:hypothetical protein CMI37_04585 [Candidatus Pacearchaeota archaeon]|nr:hypothetical protein [Candidatus Pacearchaeota archaeon]|tara:strand:- start:523 stop:750 length:228 start_codon:yes stop_codon:yes gene_type:complete
MKFLLENWRKLLEGEVIDFPHQPRISEADLQFIIMVEDSSTQRLKDAYGNISEVPIEKFEQLDEIMNDLEELLKK